MNQPHSPTPPHRVRAKELSGWYCDSRRCPGHESHPPTLTLTPPPHTHTKDSMSFTSVFLPPSSSQAHG